MEIPQDQIEELRDLCSELSQASEGGFQYIRLHQLKLFDSCTPNTVDALLCPMERDGYHSRLFFTQVIAKQSGIQLNWNSHLRILDGDWHAYSWKTQPGLRLFEMVLIHLDALRS